MNSILYLIYPKSTFFRNMSSLASTATVGTNMFVKNPASTFKSQGLKGVSTQNGLGAVKGDSGTLLYDGKL